MTAARFAVALILLLPGALFGQDLPRGGADVRKALDQILSSPEYETELPPPNLSESFWGWVLRKLVQLFEQITHLGAAAPSVLWMIVVACPLVLARIFLHAGIILVRALRASRVGDRPRPGRTSRHDD